MLVLAAVSLSCSSQMQRPIPAPAGTAPRLILTVSPEILLRAGEIALQARYTGAVSEDWCPSIAWRYGDGETSTQQASCMGDRTVSWLVRHRYKLSGQFEPTFTLWDGPRQVGFARAVVIIGAP